MKPVARGESLAGHLPNTLYIKKYLIKLTLRFYQCVLYFT
jgi:hypothetical protein